MRFITNFVKIFSLLIIVFSNTRCTKEIAPPLSDQVKSQLSFKMWKINNVSVDGVDITSAYQNFTIQFTGNNYTTNDGGVVWPSSGTWVFTDSKKANSITRSPDGLIITIDEITSSSLALKFTWDKTTYGGRVNSVSGQYVFSLN